VNAWGWLLAAAAAAVQPLPPAPAEPVAPLSEVIVLGPEPRYVAPTQRDRIGRIWAPVYLNQQGPFRLVLDTGANRSAVTPTVAEALGVQARTTATAQVRGVTGITVAPMIRVSTMEIGDLLLQNVLLPVVPDVFGGAEGVLGNEGLRDKRIVIDFKRDFISIKRSGRERPGEGFETLPITMSRDHLLAIDVLVGRVRAKAIIDTGAPGSLGNAALLKALKRQVEDQPSTEIVGVTLDVEYGSRVRMPTIQMQNVKIRGAILTFSDVYIFKHWRMTSQPTIMLGMDVLGVLDQIIIDYRTRELHILTSDR
jgi:predicted aspartyl protease